MPASSDEQPYFVINWVHSFSALQNILHAHSFTEFSEKISRKRVEAYIRTLFHAYFDLPQNV